MPAPNAIQQVQEQPLKIVGGNRFGRYSKISIEETFNFIVSDNFLVPYAGYKSVVAIAPNAEGRGLISSTKATIMLAGIGSEVIRIDSALTPTFIGTLETSIGDVFMAENNGNQICITDGVTVYIYNYFTHVSIKSGSDGR